MQEPGGGNIVSYARQVEGVVRKADDRRKRARESKAVRRADEAAARQEEVRRLKALKRREIEERCAWPVLTFCTELLQGEAVV